MICEKCGKREATVLYTQIINGHKQTLNLCSQCAGQDSIFDNFGSMFSFGGFSEPAAKRCPICSMTLAELTRSGKMGCGECYRTFRPQAEALLKRIHGSSTHIEAEGAPKDIQPHKKTELEIMRDKLKEAIECEDFETAASLRDEIRKKEQEGK